MKVQLKSVELQKMLVIVAIIISRVKNAVNALYNNIQFKFIDGKLFLYAFDGMHVVEVAYSEKLNTEDFSAMVEFSVLKNLVNLSTSEFLEFDFQEQKLVFSEGSTAYELAIVRESDFSYLLDFKISEDKKILTISPSDIKTVTRFIQPALPTNLKLADYPGVYFDGNFVATRSISCSVAEFTPKISKGFYLSHASFQILQGLPGGDEICSLYDMGNTLLLCFANSKIMLSLIGADFPKYDAVIKKHRGHTIKCIVNKESIIRAGKKLLSITEGAIRHSCKIKFCGDLLSLTAQAENKKGEEKINLKAPITLLDAEISINLQHLISYIATVDSEDVTICLDSALGEYSIPYNFGTINGFYIETTLK